MKIKTIFFACFLLAAGIACAGVRISGCDSNFDCWNDDGNDAEGFEIELHGCHANEITHTWNYSAFGAPTVTDTSFGVRVRYFNAAVRLHPGSMTHFGFSLNHTIARTDIVYKWVHANTFGTGTYTQTVSLPRHEVQMITLDDGSKALRDVIFNPEPDGSTKAYFILPYRIDVPGLVTLESLMSDNPIVMGATPMGGGSNGLTAEQLDPQDAWGNDDAVTTEADTSQVFWYKIYDSNYDGDNTWTRGNLIGIMMDNTVTTSDGLQAIKGKITLGDFGSPIGQNVQVDIFTPGDTSAPLQSYLQPLGAAGLFTLDMSQLLTPGAYDIRIFGEHWLAKRLQNVNFSATGVQNVNATLTNGDVNGDNVVDLSDYTEILSAFNSVVGDPNYQTWVDLNGDGVVDLSDYTILITQFNALGDN